MVSVIYIKEILTMTNKAYYRQQQNLYKIIYFSQVASSKGRGHDKPTYTK